MLFDWSEYPREGLPIQLEQPASLGLDPDAQGPLLVVDECQLTKVLTLFQLTHKHKSYLWPELVNLETFNLTLLYYVEFLSLFAFLENEFVLLESDCLQSVYQLEFLILVQFIWKLITINQCSIVQKWILSTWARKMNLKFRWILKIIEKNTCWWCRISHFVFNLFKLINRF